MRLVCHMFDMAIINSCLLYKRDASSLMIPKVKIHRLCIFKQCVSSPIEAGKPTAHLKHSRHSNNITPEPKRKVLAISSMPVKDKHYNKYNHWPENVKVQRICLLEGCKGKTNKKCSKCNFHYYYNNNTNHFGDFHKQ